MHKKFFVTALLIGQLIHAQVDNKQFEDYLNEHNQAFKALEPFADKIHYSSWTSYHGNTTITHHEWRHPSEQSKSALAAYQATSKALESEILKMSFGDGFILGSVLAVCNRLINGQKINKKLIGGSIVASSILWTLYQNKSTEKTPYYSLSVRKQDNLFGQMSLLTIGRMPCSMLSATAGFCGTAYTLERLANLIKRRQNGAQVPVPTAA